MTDQQKVWYLDDSKKVRSATVIGKMENGRLVLKGQRNYRFYRFPEDVYATKDEAEIAKIL